MAMVPALWTAWNAEINPTEGASYAVTCCAVIQRLLGSRAVFESVKTNQDFVVTMNKVGASP